MPQAPTILMFDSGLGGLTVFREVKAARPDVHFIYLADDAGFPYGNLAEDELVARVTNVLGKAIAEHKPDMVVVACPSWAGGCSRLHDRPMPLPPLGLVASGRDGRDALTRQPTPRPDSALLGASARSQLDQRCGRRRTGRGAACQRSAPSSPRW